MYAWRKGIAQWVVKDALHLSVVFTWHLPEAREIAINSKKKVVVGGPAVRLMPDYLDDVAKVQHTTIYPAMQMHNPFATKTSDGCPNNCSFCAVPRCEGNLIERKSWEIKPIVCDNNLPACSKKHIRRVIKSLMPLPYVDFNQGLEAELFTPWFADQLLKLNNPIIRFAFDHISEESKVMQAVELAQRKGFKNIQCYVLFNHSDTPDDAIYRLELLRSKDVLPNPMRYQPLDTLHKNSYISKNWTDLDIGRVQRYYSKLNYLGFVPYEDYNPQDSEKRKQINLFDEGKGGDSAE